MNDDNRCWLCERPFDGQNGAKEHLIPKAIGGRRSVQGFVCRACNSSTGARWDAELADQLNHLGHLFEIKRQGKNIPAKKLQTVAGELIEIRPGNRTVIGRPFHRVTTDSDTVRIQDSVRTRGEMRKRLEDLRKDYPQIDVDKEMGKVQDAETYISVPVEITTDVTGPSADRSIVKSAVALACEAGLKSSDCGIAIEYLRNEENEYDEDGFWEYYQEDLVMNREVGLPLHCVHVAACPDSGLLLGYVEYYGMVRRVLCLSKAYEGKPVRRTYCVNPVDGQKLSDVEVDLDDSVFEVVKTQTRDGLGAGLLNAVNQIMRSGVLLSRSRTIARYSVGCMKEYCERNGLVMNNQDQKDPVELMARRLIPLLEYYSTPLEFPEGFDLTQPSTDSEVGK